MSTPTISPRDDLDGPPARLEWRADLPDVIDNALGTGAERVVTAG